MFAYQIPPGEFGTLYRQQVIHFGASYNHMSDYWPLFLVKFEELLKRMVWTEAHLFLKIEGFGDYRFQWKAGHEEISPAASAPLSAVSRWDFRGGPRSFSS